MEIRLVARSQLTLILVAAGIVLVAVALVAPGVGLMQFEPQPRVLTLNEDARIDRIGSFEGDHPDFTAQSALRGVVDVTDGRSFLGPNAVTATVRSPEGYGYARIQEEVSWQDGDDVWYGAAFYLERGFNDAQGDGSVDIIRWDNWPDHPESPDHGGLTILSDGRLALFRERRDGSTWEVVLGPYPLAEARWTWLEVRQRFSSEEGAAINEVWIDGQRRGSNTMANYFGRPITRYRVGIIATPDPQAGELRLHLDTPVIARDGPIMVLE